MKESVKMILLIGGESHTGKTLMAQRLMERYRYPYTSLDHLKMGLIRGWPGCGFTAEDSDEKISCSMWGITQGIIDTCVENQQNLILEGCYLPPFRVKTLICDKVVAAYLGFSERYIREHFSDVLRFENVIEKRLFPEGRSAEDFVKGSLRVKEECIANGLPYFEINEDYQKETAQVYGYIDKKIRQAQTADNENSPAK